MKCTHCNRDVSSTIHTRLSYKVNYYKTFVGDTTEGVKENGENSSYLRLLNPTEIITCSECFKDDEVLKQLRNWETFSKKK